MCIILKSLHLVNIVDLIVVDLHVVIQTESSDISLE